MYSNKLCSNSRKTAWREVRLFFFLPYGRLLLKGGFQEVDTFETNLHILYPVPAALIGSADIYLVHKAVFTTGKECRNIRNQFFRLSRSLIAMGLLGLQCKLFILGDQEVYFAECGGKLGDCSSMTEMTSCSPCRMPIGWRRNGIKKRTRRRNTGRMVRHDERFTIYHL